MLVSVVCGTGSANIASKGVPGTLKPFLRTLKRVLSTFWKNVAMISPCEDLKIGNIPQIRPFGSRNLGQLGNEKRVFRCWVPLEVHRVQRLECRQCDTKAYDKSWYQKTEEQGFCRAETSGNRNKSYPLCGTGFLTHHMIVWKIICISESRYPSRPASPAKTYTQLIQIISARLSTSVILPRATLWKIPV